MTESCVVATDITQPCISRNCISASNSLPVNFDVYQFYFVHATVTPAEAQVCGSGAPAMKKIEEWEGTVTLLHIVQR